MAQHIRVEHRGVHCHTPIDQYSTPACSYSLRSMRLLGRSFNAYPEATIRGVEIDGLTRRLSVAPFGHIFRWAMSTAHPPCPSRSNSSALVRRAHNEGIRSGLIANDAAVCQRSC